MPRKPKPASGLIGRLSYKPSPEEGLVPQTLEFIRRQLPAWRDDPKRPKIESEKRLNSALCIFLNTRARFELPMACFQHEDPQHATRTVDIGIHGTEQETLVDARLYPIYEPFMVIEAKRLPAPKKEREREYVSGTSKTSGTPTGGIQRFKLGLHGAKVEAAVIVGYIEALSVQHWHQTINQWIADFVANPTSDGCKWDRSDSLEQLESDDEKGTSSAESTHQRTDDCLTSTIKIRHLWVVMRG